MPGDRDDPTEWRLTLARWIYDARGRRLSAEVPGIHGEPAWDILLDLYIHQTLGKRVAVNAACVASRAPPTTALRHIRMMCDAGVLKRVPDDGDRRRLWLELSEGAMRKMEIYLDRTMDDLRKLFDSARRPA